ncbi:Uncharacterised protein [Serratia entomophila]|nr:Uncharacterised protein [Serratia entomophila]
MFITSVSDGSQGARQQRWLDAQHDVAPRRGTPYLASDTHLYRHPTDKFRSAAISLTFSPLTFLAAIRRTASSLSASGTTLTTGECFQIWCTRATFPAATLYNVVLVARSGAFFRPSAMSASCSAGRISPRRIRRNTFSRHWRECSALASGVCSGMPQRSRYSLAFI